VQTAGGLHRPAAVCATAGGLRDHSRPGPARPGAAPDECDDQSGSGHSSSHALNAGSSLRNHAFAPSIASGWWSLIAVRTAMSSAAWS
jgi:hypothetical protein